MNHPFQSPGQPPSQDAPNAADSFLTNQAAATPLPSGAPWPAVAKYKPSGRIGPLAVPLLLLSLVIVPPLASFLYIKLWQFGHLLLLSPVLLGFLVALGILPAITLGKVRNTRLAGAFGVLAGLATCAGTVFFEANENRAEFVEAYSSRLTLIGMNPTMAHDVAEAYLTPLKLTLVYWSSSSESGLTLKSSGQKEGDHLTGFGFWAVEGLDFLVLVGGATALCIAGAYKRYSEAHDQWYTVKVMGSVPGHVVKQYIAALETGNFADARSFVTAQNPQQLGFQSHLSYLKNQPGAIVTVIAREGKYAGMQPIFERTLTNEEAKALWPKFPVQAAPSAFSG